MWCRYMLVIVSLLGLLSGHVSACDKNCANRTVFTPPRLVLRHGHPTSATCSLCPSCPNDIFSLEMSVGKQNKNGTTITWTVDRMMEWGTSPLCYYTDHTNNQCCTVLKVTVYKPPDLVSFSFTNHSGPLLESRHYTLECKVQNVAPIANVTVTFYRGLAVLGQRRSTASQKNPVTEDFTMSINTTKEDDGAQYWCRAELKLGPYGPHTPPMVTSNKLTATVHYKPQHLEPPSPDLITLTQGNPLQLNCMAVGNPRPSYSWTVLPADVPPSNSSVLIIQSVGFGHEGLYTCSVSNDVGTSTVTFRVAVKANIIPYVVAVALALLVGTIIGICILYKKRRMGQYNLKDVLHLRSRHVAVPTKE